MKKIFATALIFLMSMGFSGCGENNPAKPINIIKIGTIKNLNASENLYNSLIKKFEERVNFPLSNHEYTFYDSFTLLQMGLESGSINEASTYKYVANYLIAKNPNFVPAEKHEHLKMSDNFSLAMRAEDTELKNSVNATLDMMKKDGTLEKLTQHYIRNLNIDEEPQAVEFEKFDGAETVKVGITGDLPPMDLVLADGKPAGFNTALLSELGKRMQKNIEIVQIDSAARAAALTSGKIDISFWAIVPEDSDRPADVDKPQGIELSDTYFKDEIIHITYKK